MKVVRLVACWVAKSDMQMVVTLVVRTVAKMAEWSVGKMAVQSVE
jgi:hypothetical protein